MVPEFWLRLGLTLTLTLTLETYAGKRYGTWVFVRVRVNPNLNPRDLRW